MARIFRSIRDRFRAGADPVAIASELAADYRMVFGTEAGHRVLADLLRRSGVLLSTYREDDDVNGMPFREGQRAVGLYVIHKLNETPATLARFARAGETRELYDDE